MSLNTLQLILLKKADTKYGTFEVLELENNNNNVVGIPDFTYDEVVIALKELEDDFLIEKNSTQSDCLGGKLFITGNIQITSKGHNYLKQN
ncbi:hypothetical protein Ahae5227_17890 (plasmid) [Acinetobacter haemolyticus]|uniref:hypothetical protein n=1 Tax=Acinetobacter haemolyticus TaxID=29430 RepID=UPI001331F4DE|nr:hypothetical protein [Acinetobacter haemolyticus]QHI24740.1 hypothetical protein Ahae5227_17890 [Acinetobacter haemolyticus]